MLGDAARLPARSHHARNASSAATVGARSFEHVEAPLDRVRLCRDGHQRVDAAHLGAGRIIGRPQRTRDAVDDHQASHPLGVIGRENESAHRGETRREDRRLLTPDRIHHRDRVLGPKPGADHVHREDARREANSAWVEPDQSAERRKASVEPVHRRLGVDRVNRDERPGQREQIDRAIAEDLVGDVHVAALGVASPR
jgi:hypothetical protein